MSACLRTQLKVAGTLFAILAAHPAVAQTSLSQSNGCLDHPSIECGPDINVIDGDTFEVEGQIIRLWGIDAPELDQHCRAFSEPVPAGELAAELLESLVYSLSHCEPMGDQPEDRTIARCHQTDGDDLGGEMVAAGYAWDWPEVSGGAYADRAAEAVAGGLGLTTIECQMP
ncbi:MAG: thermonuclease family protein, partial [Pseudomonadota bacterium]